MKSRELDQKMAEFQELNDRRLASRDFVGAVEAATQFCDINSVLAFRCNYHFGLWN